MPAECPKRAFSYCVVGCGAQLQLPPDEDEADRPLACPSLVSTFDILVPTAYAVAVEYVTGPNANDRL